MTTLTQEARNDAMKYEPPHLAVGQFVWWKRGVGETSRELALVIRPGRCAAMKVFHRQLNSMMTKQYVRHVSDPLSREKQSADHGVWESLSSEEAETQVQKLWKLVDGIGKRLAAIEKAMEKGK